MSFVIVDLDNCIADDGWRLSKINPHGQDDHEMYHDYHLLSGFDTFCNRHVFKKKPRSVLVVTSRPMIYRAIAIEWLGRNLIPCKGLLMRKMGDQRPPVEVKGDYIDAILGTYTKENGGAVPPIAVAYDDDPAIIAMYEAKGIRAERLFIHEGRDYESHDRAVRVQSEPGKTEHINTG